MLRDASARLAVLHQAERENSQSTAKVSEDSGPQARRYMADFLDGDK